MTAHTTALKVAAAIAAHIDNTVSAATSVWSGDMPEDIDILADTLVTETGTLWRFATPAEVDQLTSLISCRNDEEHAGAINGVCPECGTPI